MQIVIPCGGLATRLGSLAKDTPKAMIDINGKPFIQHQLDLIKKHDIKKVLLCINHLGENIQSYFKEEKPKDLKIKYSYDDSQGVIGALKTAEDLLDNEFFLMYGDSYLQDLDLDDLYFRYLNQNRLVMMSVWNNNNQIDPSNVKVKKGVVISYGEKDSDFIDYGAIVVSKKALDIVPENTIFGTGDFWRTLIEKDELSAYEVDERYYDVGDPKRLQEVRELLKN